MAKHTHHDESPRRLTPSERIAADLDAFRKAGGRIEKLGTTQVLKKIDPIDSPSKMRSAGERRGRIR